MDVEYQKKEITWCLDRIGPKICLKASAINDKLQQLEITSDGFRLEFENEEAIEFLGILRNIMATKPASVQAPDHERPSIPVQEDKLPSISITEDYTPLSSITEEVPTPIPYVKQPEDEVIPVPRIKEAKPKPITTLDTSEILEVLKQSESSVGDERISFRKKFAENEALEKGPDPTENLQLEVEESTLGIAIEENVPPSEIFKEKLDTASFFREAEEKSPLEQLLEENEDLTGEIITAEPPLPESFQSHVTEEIPPSEEEKVPFSPDDLNSSSFMSNFNSKPFEQELETQKPEIMENSVETDLDHQDIDPIQQGAFLSEDDRKKEVERERAARKKRLWELTRGF